MHGSSGPQQLLQPWFCHRDVCRLNRHWSMAWITGRCTSRFVHARLWLHGSIERVYVLVLFACKIWPRGSTWPRLVSDEWIHISDVDITTCEYVVNILIVVVMNSSSTSLIHRYIYPPCQWNDLLDNLCLIDCFKVLFNINFLLPFAYYSFLYIHHYAIFIYLLIFTLT